jgi:hypothetical protein
MPGVVVVNRLTLNTPVAELAEIVEHEFLPTMRALPGFERFVFLEDGEGQATVLIEWGSPEAAQAGSAQIGPTLFNEHVIPRLAAPQDRKVGRVLVDSNRVPGG